MNGLAGEDVPIRLHRLDSPVTTLGPFSRAVIWVQGCPFNCKGCITRESIDPTGGFEMSVREIADWVIAQEGVEGITLSGGEPMEQSGALALVIDLAKDAKDLGIVCYTGYTLEAIRKAGRKDKLDLVSRTDLLIDGQYIPEKHADLLWRGSSNQRLIHLTDRYRAEVEMLTSEGDHSAGVEVKLNQSGKLEFTGVPATPGFRDRMYERACGENLESSNEEAE